MSTEARDTADSGGRRPIVVFALLAGLAGLILLGGNLLMGRLRQPTDLRPVAVAGTTGPTATAISLTVSPLPTGTHLTCVGTSCLGSDATQDLTPTAARLPSVSGTPTIVPSQEASRTPTTAITAPATVAPGAGTLERPAPSVTVRGNTIVTIPGSPTPVRVAVIDTIDPNSPAVPDVVSAYLWYWEVRGLAYRSGDPLRLPEVLVDPQLGEEQMVVSRLHTQGRAVQIDGEHVISLFEISGDTALLVDEFVNRSIVLDAATGRPLQISTPVTPPVNKLVVTLWNVDGVWKVAQVSEDE